MSLPSVPNGEFLLYQTEDGHSRIEVRIQGETVWLTQNQMADLFGVDKSGISRHLKSVYESGNWRLKQLVQNMQQLLPTEKTTR